jgi:hypothetical protein
MCFGAFGKSQVEYSPTLIAPRHPERFEEVAGLVVQNGSDSGNERTPPGQERMPRSSFWIRWENLLKCVASPR